jgi:hypothetical protein
LLVVVVDEGADRLNQLVGAHPQLVVVGAEVPGDPTRVVQLVVGAPTSKPRENVFTCSEVWRRMRATIALESTPPLRNAQKLRQYSTGTEPSKCSTSVSR